jgi:hypothetical protein
LWRPNRFNSPRLNGGHFHVVSRLFGVGGL